MIKDHALNARGIGGIAPLILIVALEGGDSFSRLVLVTRGADRLIPME